MVKLPTEITMSKQTAVEWLVDELLSGKLLMPDLIEQAKEMEKDQIVEAFNEGENFSEDYFIHPYNTPECEVYYKQTYGGDNE
jgi:hypothetical protein